MNNNYNYCNISKPEPLFFSLVDYHNNYFVSNNLNKILEFYNNFSNKEELISWMRERPKGNYNIKEFEGKKDIIVVIPTVDINNKFAKNCRENIFNGLHIIFVESGYNNYYFNYAHNCNAGIRKALEYNPKWIIVSNDDMFKIDDISELVKQLTLIDNNKVMSVFTIPSIYHSYNTCIGTRRWFLTDFSYFIYSLFSKANLFTYRIKRNIAKNKKYNLKWMLGPRNKLLCKFFLNNVYTYTMTSTLSILNSRICRKEGVFNETYLNGVEDWELSIELSRLEKQVIDFKIGDLIGESLGNFVIRGVRDLVNIVYFNERIKSLLSREDI